MPTLSIIIPVFNGGKTLDSCLQSILSQTYNDYEVIVCDGQSTDDTLGILSKHADKVVLSSVQDKGVYDAMNRGLNLASGDWIYFLGADDVLANSKVLDSVFSHDYQGVDLVLGMAKHENLSSKKVPVDYRSSLSSKTLWRNTVHHQSAFYHKSIFTDFRYNIEYKILADYHLNLRLLKSGARSFEIDEVIAVCDASGLSKQFNSSLYKEEIRLKSTVLSPTEMLVQRMWIWIKFLWKNS